MCDSRGKHPDCIQSGAVLQPPLPLKIWREKEKGGKKEGKGKEGKEGERRRKRGERETKEGKRKRMITWLTKFLSWGNKNCVITRSYVLPGMGINQGTP